MGALCPMSANRRKVPSRTTTREILILAQKAGSVGYAAIGIAQIEAKCTIADANARTGQHSATGLRNLSAERWQRRTDYIGWTLP